MGQSALCRLALLLCPVEICRTGEYNPEWPIRVIDHILGDEENFSRLPAEVRDARNLPLLVGNGSETGAAEGGCRTGHHGASGLPGLGAISPANLSD